MTLQVVRFLSLLFTILALCPGMAHVLELPNKIHLPGEDYLRVQQIYRGWALVGITVVVALASTVILAIMVRARPVERAWVVVALLSLAVTQVIFWTFTFPVNKRTENWSRLPANWLELRSRWEYSHAASATFNFIAIVALILAVLTASAASVAGAQD
jgi:hypothetical protein